MSQFLVIFYFLFAAIAFSLQAANNVSYVFVLSIMRLGAVVADEIIVVLRDLEIIDRRRPFVRRDLATDSVAACFVEDAVALFEPAHLQPALADDEERVFAGHVQRLAPPRAQYPASDAQSTAPWRRSNSRTGRQLTSPEKSSRAATRSPTAICSIGVLPVAVSTSVPSAKEAKPGLQFLGCGFVCARDRA